MVSLWISANNWWNSRFFFLFRLVEAYRNFFFQGPINQIRNFASCSTDEFPIFFFSCNHLAKFVVFIDQMTKYFAIFWLFYAFINSKTLILWNFRKINDLLNSANRRKIMNVSAISTKLVKFKEFQKNAIKFQDISGLFILFSRTFKNFRTSTSTRIL